MKKTQRRLLYLGPMRPGIASPVLAGLIEELHSHADWTVRALDTSQDNTRLLDEFDPQALVVQRLDEQPIPWLEHELKRYHRPVVTVGARAKGGGSSATLDERMIGRIAAEWLIERGYRYFAYLGGAVPHIRSARLGGFQDALKSAGFASEVFESDQSLSPWLSEDNRESHRAVQQWLEKLPRPLAVFSDTEASGSALIEICRGAEIRIPSEVAVLSAGYDPAISHLSRPALSGIRLNRRCLGAQAARLILAHCEDPDRESEHVTVAPGEIVPHDSTGALAIRDPLVHEAVAFIGSHLADNLKVLDVARAVNASRATLEKRFRLALNRTPLEEIHRQKLERVRQLLRSGVAPLADVAAQTGFCDQFHLAAFFKKKTGHSPTHYRSQTSDFYQSA